MFVGVTQASSIPSTSGSNTNFTLSNGTNGRTFYPFAGGTIPANKAYLRIPTDKVADNPEDGMALFFDRGTKGDVNDDGKIDVTDVVLMVNVILNNRSAFFNPWAADANDDDEVNINDVVIIVNLILNN